MFPRCQKDNHRNLWQKKKLKICYLAFYYFLCPSQTCLYIFFGQTKGSVINPCHSFPNTNCKNQVSCLDWDERGQEYINPCPPPPSSHNGTHNLNPNGQLQLASPRGQVTHSKHPSDVLKGPRLTTNPSTCQQLGAHDITFGYIMNIKCHEVKLKMKLMVISVT